MLITTPTINPTTPAWVLILAAGLLLLIAELLRSGRIRKTLSPAAVSLFAMGVAGLCLFECMEQIDTRGPLGIVAADRFAFVVQLGLLLAVSALLVARFSTQRGTAESYAAFGSILLATAGGLLATLADDAVETVLALELSMLPLVWPLAFGDGDDTSPRVARGFLAANGLSTLLLAVALALLAGLAGSTSFDTMRTTFASSYLSEKSVGQPSVLGHVAAVMVIAGLGWKLAAAPFHVGIDNLIGKTSTSFEAVLHLVPKCAALVILIRLIPVLMAFRESFQLALTVTAVATMTVGNIHAVTRTRVREIVGYLAMAHIGYTLAGCAVGCFESRFPDIGLAGGSGLPSGLQAAVLHLLTLSVAVIGAMSLLRYLDRPERPIDELEDLSGIIRRQPIACVSLAIALLSLAGIPPLPGFWSQLLLMSANLPMEMKSSIGHVVVLLVLLNLLMTAGACLKIVATMCFEPLLGRPRPSGGRPALIVGVAAAVMLLMAGLLMGRLIRGVETLDLTKSDPPRSVAAGTTAKGIVGE
ncbi:MAG: proton-conducting transporter membrane subunit [Planctomycetota bacterium]|nr:proton-conducting transporter membrane subunit [Planctomycetota bacterium]